MTFHRTHHGSWAAAGTGMLQLMLLDVGQSLVRMWDWGCRNSGCEEELLLGDALAAGHNSHSFHKLQDSMAKFPCAPGRALSHSSFSPVCPSADPSPLAEPGIKHPFSSSFGYVSLWTIFHGKEKGFFPPPTLQLLISFSSYPPQSLPSLLCCPEPPAQIQLGQLSQKTQKLLNIAGQGRSIS